MPTITPDGVRGDIANALEIARSMRDDRGCLSVAHDQSINAIEARLQVALHKIDKAAKEAAREQSTVGDDADGSKA